MKKWQRQSGWKDTIRRLEKFFQYIITGGRRFSALCDSRIKLCWLCSFLRHKIRRGYGHFTVFTKDGAYIFDHTGHHIHSIPKCPGYYVEFYHVINKLWIKDNEALIANKKEN